MSFFAEWVTFAMCLLNSCFPPISVQNTIVTESATFQNNVIMCQFTRQPSLGGDATFYNISGDNAYFILLAVGNSINTDGKIWPKRKCVKFSIPCVAHLFPVVVKLTLTLTPEEFWPKSIPNRQNPSTCSKKVPQLLDFDGIGTVANAVLNPTKRWAVLWSTESIKIRVWILEV